MDSKDKILTFDKRLRRTPSGEIPVEPAAAAEEALDDEVTEAILTAMDRHYPGWQTAESTEFSGMHPVFNDDDPDDDYYHRFICWRFTIGTEDEV